MIPLFRILLNAVESFDACPVPYVLFYFNLFD